MADNIAFQRQLDCVHDESNIKCNADLRLLVNKLVYIFNHISLYPYPYPNHYPYPYPNPVLHAFDSVTYIVTSHTLCVMI